MNCNYDKEFEKCIAEIRDRQQLPTLLLHACCAPCSSSVLERVCGDFAVTVFYFNPNISPKEEYDKRVEEEKKLLSIMNAGDLVRVPIALLEGEYCPERFFEMAKGLENAPERGERCLKCYDLRLRETARVAKERGFDYFTTTLTLSPLKDAAALNTIGFACGKDYDVSFLPSDFKKKNGYLRSIELSKEYDLYRQDFCGCVFSKNKK